MNYKRLEESRYYHLEGGFSYLFEGEYNPSIDKYRYDIADNILNCHLGLANYEYHKEIYIDSKKDNHDDIAEKLAIILEMSEDELAYLVFLNKDQDGVCFSCDLSSDERNKIRSFSKECVSTYYGFNKIKSIIKNVSKNLQEKDCKIELTFSDLSVAIFESNSNEFGTDVECFTGAGEEIKRFNINFATNIAKIIKEKYSDISSIKYDGKEIESFI